MAEFLEYRFFFGKKKNIRMTISLLQAQRGYMVQSDNFSCLSKVDADKREVFLHQDGKCKGRQLKI